MNAVLDLIRDVQTRDEARQLADVGAVRRDLTAKLEALGRADVLALADALGVILIRRTKKWAVERIVRHATEWSHARELIAY